jgi:hypothetical protein
MLEKHEGGYLGESADVGALSLGPFGSCGIVSLSSCTGEEQLEIFAALPDMVNPVTSIDPAPGREQYSVCDTCALERGNRPVQSVCLGEAHSLAQRKDKTV